MAVERQVPRGASVRWAAVIFVLAATAFAGGTLSGSGRWALAAYMSAASLLCISVYLVLIRGVGQSFSPKVFFFVNAMAPGNIALFCVATAFGGDHLFPWSEALFERPLRSAAGLLSVPLAVASVYALHRLVVAPTEPLRLGEIIAAGRGRLEMFLIIAAGVSIFGWVAVLQVGNPVFYLLRILRSALSLSALAAGLCSSVFWRSNIAWAICLALGLIGSLLTGSRGMGLIPIGLFLVGMFIAAKSKFKLLLFILPVVFGLLTLSGYIGSVRDVVGRRDLAMVMENGSILEDADMFANAGMVEEDSFLYRGLRRVISWPPAVVPAMTPEAVPYRGFADLAAEIRSAFSIKIFELAAAEGRRGDLVDNYWGEISLLPYGFAVSETSSVEFGALSDGYTRGGWPTAFIYGLIVTCVLFALETIMRKLLLPRRVAVFAIMLCVLAAFGATSFQLNPLVMALRTVALYTTFSLTVFFVLDVIGDLLGARSGRRR